MQLHRAGQGDGLRGAVERLRDVDGLGELERRRRVLVGLQCRGAEVLVACGFGGADLADLHGDGRLGERAAVDDGSALDVLRATDHVHIIPLQDLVHPVPGVRAALAGPGAVGVLRVEGAGRGRRQRGCCRGLAVDGVRVDDRAGDDGCCRHDDDAGGDPDDDLGAFAECHTQTTRERSGSFKRVFSRRSGRGPGRLGPGRSRLRRRRSRGSRRACARGSPASTRPSRRRSRAGTPTC
ncbi:hypothetical protein BACI9J_530002 [Bacillus altitudinis]|nr:hypothetical protein BACI9J_530002 [Bacillus altitudinis]